MKRFLLLLIIISLMLSSCTKPDSGGFFEYQENIESALITYTDELGKYKARLSFKEGENQRYCYKIEYLSPENISGLVFQKDKDKTDIRLDGLSFSTESIDTERLFLIASLFNLRSEDIITLSQSAKKSIAKGMGDNIHWKVTTDKSGTPIEIESTGAYNCHVIIESLK